MAGVERGRAKTINFGLVYGMGIRKLRASLGLSEAEGEALFSRYHENVPFVKLLGQSATQVARNRGYVRTILGRRRRFETWEPYDWAESKSFPLPKDAALAKYGRRIARAGTFKALNSVIQGSAADIMKLAMVLAHESGVYGVLGTPSLTVHDELDGSKPKGKAGDEALLEVKNIMETCIKLHVPLLCDCETGPDWGHVSKFEPVA